MSALRHSLHLQQHGLMAAFPIACAGQSLICMHLFSACAGHMPVQPSSVSTFKTPAFGMGKADAKLLNLITQRHPDTSEQPLSVTSALWACRMVRNGHINCHDLTFKSQNWRGMHV